MQLSYDVTPNAAAGGLNPELSPQQLRDVLSAQPEQALAVSTHRNADEALRAWMWQHGDSSLRLAMYKHYLTQRDQLIGAGVALPAAAERFDAEVTSTYEQWQEGLVSADADELTRTFTTTVTNTSEQPPASVQVTPDGMHPSPAHATADTQEAAQDPAQDHAHDAALHEDAAHRSAARAGGGIAEAISALRLPDGSQIDITSPLVLIGRSPSDAQHPGAQLVAFSDEQRLLSSNHAMLRLYEGNWFIDDLGSTNGTIVGHDPRASRQSAGETAYLPGPFLLGGLPFWLAMGAAS